LLKKRTFTAGLHPDLDCRTCTQRIPEVLA
jgi:hypothetical protein